MSKRFYALTDGKKIYEVRLMTTDELRQANREVEFKYWWEPCKVTIGE